MPKKKEGAKILEAILKIAWAVFRELTRGGGEVSFAQWRKQTRRKADCSWDEARDAVHHHVQQDPRVGKKKKKDGGKQDVFFYQQKPRPRADSPPPSEVSGPDSDETRTSGKERRLYSEVAAFIKKAEKGCDCEVLGDKGKKKGLRMWTPDVVAILRPPDNIKSLNFSPEVISVEVKADGEVPSVIAGFGQACAYKVFSHKSYFVAPESAMKEERLLPLCDIFGIGLILFEETPDGPVFSVHSRAKSHQPSMHHVAKFLRNLPDTVRSKLVTTHYA